MSEITNIEMIEKAQSVINPQLVGDRLFGDVGCVLLSKKGNFYYGVCIDTGSGTGFCAEHSAIAAMVTAGEYKIRKIVAVWQNDNKETHVLSPCGRCREFMRQIDESNMETEVILDTNKIVKLKTLLPYADWFKKVDTAEFG